MCVKHLAPNWKVDSIHFIHIREKKPRQNKGQNETMNNFGISCTAHKYTTSVVLATAGPKWMKLSDHGI